MPEFDVPGLGKARMNLTALARNPRAARGPSLIKAQLVESLYAEIRAARLAGYSWKRIRAAVLESGISMRVSAVFLRESFSEIDKRYEKETGVKALPTGTRRRKKKAPSYSGAQDSDV